MKTLKLIYHTLVLAILLVCISCEKMIEVDMPGNQIGTGQVFEDSQTANAALAGLYASLFNASPLAGNESGQLLGTYTDDLVNYAVNSTNIYDIYRNQQIENNLVILTEWSNTYQIIYQANAIIQGIENSAKIPPADKKRIKGEAILIRSIMLFYLQQLFGDIPYVTSTDYEVNRTITKTAASEVLIKLEADLNFSIMSLDDAYTNTERIFPNRKVAELMLAKVFMVQQRWNEAEILLTNIIQNPLYQFQNDINKVFEKSGKHILWQLKPKNPGDPTKEAQTYYFINSAPTTFALSQDLINVFTTGDLRKQNWMAQVSVNGNTWFRANKYRNLTNNSTEYSIIFRLDEVYLTLAECLTQQNKTMQALPFVNATRQRAGLNSLTGAWTKDNLLIEILLEDRKEFFTEMGLRFLILKRTGMLNTLTTAKPNWKQYHNLWPIPQQEILINQNLKPQNTGY